MKLVTFEDYKTKVEEFEKFLDGKHPAIPKGINKVLLTRCLKVCELDFKKAAELLEVNIEFRSKHDNLFGDRKFHEKRLVEMRDVQKFFYLPKVQDDGSVISFHVLGDTDASKYDLFAVLRSDIMFIDINQGTLAYPVLNDCDVSLIDCKGVSFRHLLKFIPLMWELNTFLNFVQESIFYKLKEVHLFNVSATISKIYSLLKPFIKKELQEQIFFHTNHEELYDIIDKENLPNEYGGKVGTIDELHKSFIERCERDASILKEYEIFKVEK